MLPELMQLADAFQLEGLRILCQEFKVTGLTIENACVLFQQRHEGADEAEKHFAWSFMEDNFAQIMKMPSFLELGFDRLLLLLQSDNVCILCSVQYEV